MTNGSNLMVSFTGPYNYTGSGYNVVSGLPSSLTGGYASTTSTNEYGRFATALNGSATTYTCDYWYHNKSGTYFAGVGGYCGFGSNCGASYVDVGYTSSNSCWSVGTSLSFV